MFAKRPAYRSLFLPFLAVIGVGQKAGDPAGDTVTDDTTQHFETATASIPERLRAVRARLALEAWEAQVEEQRRLRQRRETRAMIQLVQRLQ